MADEVIQYIGQAIAVAQVDTATPANVEIGDIFEMTLQNAQGRSSSLSFTATAATVQNVVEGLQALADTAKTANQSPWDEVTVTEDDTKCIITADVEGVAFTLTCTATDGGGTDDQTLTRAAVTANAGPNVWGSEANWLDDSGNNTVPGSETGQIVHVKGAEILYDLDQSGISNGLAELHISGSQIGQDPYSTYGDGVVPTYLQIKMAASGLVTIGKYTGPNTLTEQSPVFVDIGANAAFIEVHNSLTTGARPAVCVKANHSSATLTVHKGRVGVCYYPGETGELASIDSRYKSSSLADTEVHIGSGLTLATLNINGGKVTCNSSVTTINAILGQLITYGVGAIGTLNLTGCSCTLNSTGTITTLNGKQTVTAGIIDLTKSGESRTIATLKIDPGITLKDNPAVTKTNAIQLYSTDRLIQLIATAL